MPQKKKFRNKFEATAAEVLKGLCRYEPFLVPYITERNYIPDFVGTGSNGKTLLIECKGFFRVGDIQKYKAIRNSIQDEQELVFVLYDPNKKTRKGGKMTMSSWCEKEGIRWFTVDTIKDAFDA